MYVWPNSPATQDGLTWNTAFHELGRALATQTSGGVIWVAKGFSYPANVVTTYTNYTTGFIIPNPLQIYGGLTVNGGSLASRTTDDMKSCVLEGGYNLGQQYTAYHIITIQELTTDPVIIDGFKIQDANANDTSNTGNQYGGGIYAPCANLNLANIIFNNNHALWGGGVFIQGGCSYQGDPPTPPLSHPRQLTIKNSQFLLNSADDRGGAIYGDDIYGEIVNVTFFVDHAPQYGGAIYLWNMGTSNLLTLMNCSFDKNFVTANQDTSTPPVPWPAGAGVYLGETATSPPVGGNARIVNCTFAQNYTVPVAGEALGVSTNSLCTVENSIFWRNWFPNGGFYAPLSGAINVNNTDVEQGYAGNYNINADPGFTLLDRGHILDESVYDVLTFAHNTSLCVDAADWDQRPHDDLDVNGNGNVTELVSIDLNKSNRTSNSHFGGPLYHGGHGSRNYLDMGAFEFQEP
jgi:predicted outer membrane repeat protein